MQPTDTDIIRLAIAKQIVEQELNETLTDEQFYALVLKAPVDLLAKRGQPHRSFGTKAIDRDQITDLVTFIQGEDR